MRALVAIGLLLCLVGAVAGPGPARAADPLTFQVEIKDGTITPGRIEVPADTPFRLEIYNAGARVAEFESNELHREKVMTPKSRTSLVFRKLSAGEYVFFDDFDPDGGKMLLVVK